MWYFFDYFCDVIYVLDVVIVVRIGFLEEGILVIDIKWVYMWYICFVEFIVDVVLLILIDILYVILGFFLFLRINCIVKGYKSFCIKVVMEL